MKKTFLLLLMSISLAGMAQIKKDIVNPNVPMVFLGCDFAKIRFTKAADFINKPQINRFFVDCNHLIQETPPYKNGFANKLQRDIVKDFSYVTTVNAAVDYQTIFIDDTNYGISDDGIANMIADLKIDQQKYKDHIGFLIVEENYSKAEVEGKVALVFFTINDLKPILIKHDSFKPSGFGFLYYWNYVNLKAMKSLPKIIKEIKKG